MPLKNKIVIGLMLIGSAYFMYAGFSILFHEGEQKSEKVEAQSSLEAR